MRIFLVSSLVYLLVVPTALAQPSSRFPDSVEVLHEGGRYRAFDLGNFKELLRMDADLMHAEATAELQARKITKLEASISLFQEALILEQENVSSLLEYQKELFEKWETENRLRHELENKPNAGAITGWVSSLVLGVLSVILFTHMVF